MTRFATILAAALLGAAAQHGEAEEFSGCGGDEAIDAAAMNGTWRVDQGNANVGGMPMGAAGDAIGIAQVFGSGLDLDIDGTRITLDLAGRDEEPLDWPAGQKAPLDPEELEVVVGCPLGDLPRWSGDSRVSQAGRTAIVFWNLIAVEEDWAILQYSLDASPPAFGYFQIVR